ncbi:MAG TPA: acetyl-CoA hydrolase/transferase C-terminal domain-containing protein [Thermomicrobiaceae bacterium]|nr:acetyl-CoA hydrolase/transferase C-terminal domain-containing protein [Thermomicrobiaceae bacterium]
MRVVSASEAVELISSRDRVYVHEVAMVPTSLVDALVTRAPLLRDVEVVHLHTEGRAPYLNPDLEGHLRHNALFVGPNARDAVNEGRADYTPVFLSEIPALIADGTLPVDVALVQVSPPDRHGFCRLGVSVACARAAVDNARIVIAEFNPRVPQTLGNSAVHVSRITAAVEVDRQLPAHAPEPFGAVDRAIGEHVAALVPDGATLQAGIGTVPNAVLAALRNHHDLGVHTEMFTDGVIDLIEGGVITNRMKTRFKGRVITSFAMGSQRLYDFVDDNPFVEFHSTGIVNDPVEIRQQSAMVAINSAIQIDITGQVCADSIGERIYSGIGGQMDFVQGALRSPGGKAIIALQSTARGGTVSRIVPQLAPGSGVVTTRGHVQWVVSEYGAVNLRGRSLRERAELLIGIAHPDFRAELRALAAARRLFGVAA